ncbi:Protein SCO1-like, mitochondrial [Hondaea fermentalgiana]|uniref:Protein SCO1-like, mitochondrial n=1 Tax=Hondaea fermentalgiana TaxID=2315210 RepID=A0A2R5G7M7_9STRA|nr:Protein SCO1-like, mitochondrial [Hondaea fermentalgiana]|eukprot:GBG26545.1 Protein SCO1-like, mitochondrial [Hondaea fermentalgiana]
MGRGRGPISWASFALMATVGAGLVAYYVKEKEAKIERVKAKNQRVIGKPLLGGPWTLVDHTGRPVTDASLKEGGHTHALLYFGFTYCPDICPAELIKITEIVEKLDADPEIGPRVVPVFISVDPKRDGVDQVAHYIKDFHPRMIGLTGTPGQVQRACKAFRVYHSIADQDEENEDDYLVDHSIVSYLIGPDGKFLDFYTQLTEADEAVERIKNQILAPPEEE